MENHIQSIHPRAHKTTVYKPLCLRHSRFTLHQRKKKTDIHRHIIVNEVRFWSTAVMFHRNRVPQRILVWALTACPLIGTRTIRIAEAKVLVNQVEIKPKPLLELQLPNATKHSCPASLGSAVLLFFGFGLFFSMLYLMVICETKESNKLLIYCLTDMNTNLVLVFIHNTTYYDDLRFIIFLHAHHLVFGTQGTNHHTPPTK